MNAWQYFKKDFSTSASIAGLITVLVSLTGPVAIIIQAAKAGGLSQMQLTSWIWAMSITSGVCGLWLSVRYRTPIVCAFSTGGAALLIDALPHYSYNDIIGAYIFAALLVVLLGVSGLFSRLMQHVPRSIVSGMLAGILFAFGAHLFVSLQQAPALVLPIILAYLIIKRVIPRYAVLAALLTGIVVCIALGQLNTQVLSFSLVIPEFTVPGLSIPALVGSVFHWLLWRWLRNTHRVSPSCNLADITIHLSLHSLPPQVSRPFCLLLLACTAPPWPQSQPPYAPARNAIRIRNADMWQALFAAYSIYFLVCLRRW
ncbi:hypothetical protein TKWG_10780 [Advenella kashmirensis WT001]|uniref:Benzoate membrane transport protein n=1 Tax=Advenella kashmirensis (strain DSM 17095 / LMG 22695 / WT001) TaxID=1036672 RepID=I3UBL4_ADVKW|nr:hypothetical protein TKWG_10780 [Advenella kashmirensis WT001]